MNVYTGKSDRKNRFQVFKNGIDFSPARSLKVRNHSPDGFAWSYNGSGPAQLALAILLEETDEETAQNLYQIFKFKIIANLSEQEWTIDSELVRKFICEE